MQYVRWPATTVQVKGHVEVALADLRSPDVTSPVAAAQGSAHHVTAHRAMRTRGYKLLAETCMDEKPPDLRAALSAFHSAVPELPPLALRAHGAPVATAHDDGALNGALPDDVSEKLMQARPCPCRHLRRVCNPHTGAADLPTGPCSRTAHAFRGHR